MAIHRGLLVIVLTLLALVAATFAVSKATTDYLLYEDATSTAERWARDLAENVRDLEQIARGEKPSSLSLQYLTWAQQLGLVFRYVIFNREGYSQMVADRQQIAPVNISVHSDEAASAGRNRRSIVAVRNGGTDGLPALFAEAFVPIVADGQLIGTVAAYVDQTEQRDRFAAAFLTVAAGISLLTGLAFGVPAAAWYRRTREKECADEEIRFLSVHDGMTRLMNRSRLKEELSAALGRGAATGDEIAVYYVDLDRFKPINETFGHGVGDAVIKQVADRLRTRLQPNDVLARIGDDEFVFVQLAVVGPAAAEHEGAETVALISKPFTVNGQDIAVTASVGVALAPQDGTDTERLIKCAQLAVERSKAEGRNCCRSFTPDMDAELCARLKLETRIRAAARTDAFELHFQPMVAMPDGRLNGFEALLRLNGEDGQPIAPSVFVPMAEQMGLIAGIGASVLRRACITAAQWPADLTVAVNLSSAQFEAGGVCDAVAAALAASALSPHRLELEITETLLLRQTDSVMAELARLKSLGVSIAMDDFGTGYSSLSYLWRFPFDKIKVDQAFMQNLKATEASMRTIVRTIIALGHSLNMRVTVEGVENAMQADFVRDVACDEVQGFYFGRPMPATEISSRLLSEFLEPTFQTFAGDGKLRVVR